jgi:hypothetical protein
MGDKIYVISYDEYDYDYNNHEALVAFTNKEKAENTIELFEELLEYQRGFYNTVKEYVNTLKTFDISQPPKPDAPPEMKALQVALSQSKGSQQLKERVKELQQKHLDNLKVYNEEYREWCEKQNIAHKEKQRQQEEYIERNYNPPSHLSHIVKYFPYSASHFGYKGGFNIEEVELVET